MNHLKDKFETIMPLVDKILLKGGHVYIVGGAVRDYFLQKESKDLDIVITGVQLDSILDILSTMGKIKEVGKSFGIIKFIPFGQTEEIDIALPRTERKTGTGYQGFEVTVDHLLPIESDLERRDFTINSMAYSFESGLVDPFNGYTDLKNGLIKMTNPVAFGEDPLRMLRAIQFASRFGFEIEDSTFESIKKNSHLIKEISSERILIEFEKIVTKGDIYLGVKKLVISGLYKELFGEPKNPASLEFEFGQAKTIAEFLTLLFLLRKQAGTKLRAGSDIYKNEMHGDIDTFKAMQAIEFGLQAQQVYSYASIRFKAYKMFKMSPASFDCKFFSNSFSYAIEELKSGEFPKSLKELVINGNDLVNIGYVGPEIGKMLDKIMLDIYDKKVTNTKEDILNFLKPH